MPIIITGRQLIIDATAAPIVSQTLWMHSNFKVIDAWWQEGVTVGDTFTLIDFAGRTFGAKLFEPNYPVALGKLDWIEGPATVSLSSGIVYMVLGNK